MFHENGSLRHFLEASIDVYQQKWHIVFIFLSSPLCSYFLIECDASQLRSFYDGPCTVHQLLKYEQFGGCRQFLEMFLIIISSSPLGLYVFRVSVPHKKVFSQNKNGLVAANEQVKATLISKSEGESAVYRMKEEIDYFLIFTFFSTDEPFMLDCLVGTTRTRTQEATPSRKSAATLLTIFNVLWPRDERRTCMPMQSGRW